MHELTLCQSILDLVVECARREGMSRVVRVTLEVGAAAPVEVEALNFCFPLTTRSTIAEGAELRIQTIPIRTRCRNCTCEHSPKSLIEPCPQCGAFAPEYLTGRELRVASIDGE